MPRLLFLYWTWLKLNIFCCCCVLISLITYPCSDCMPGHTLPIMSITSSSELQYSCNIICIFLSKHTLFINFFINALIFPFNFSLLVHNDIIFLTFDLVTKWLKPVWRVLQCVKKPLTPCVSKIALDNYPLHSEEWDIQTAAIKKSVWQYSLYPCILNISWTILLHIGLG